MKTLVSFEESAKLIASYLGSLLLGFDWWHFLAFLLLPDISMLGYFINSRVGAVIYNVFHHQALALAVLIMGLTFDITQLQLAGLILFGHSSMDRALGYGLKFSDSFQHTHLGWIGKAKTVDLKEKYYN